MKRAALLLLIALLVGCGDDEDINPLVPEGEINAECRNTGASCEIVPLAVGNRWLTKVTNYNTLGQETGHYTDHLVVERDTVVGSETWYFMRGLWYANRSDGLWCDPGDDNVMFFKYPAMPGDTFACDICPYHHVVTSIDKTVTIDAGSFYCYEYTTAFDGGDTSISYMAPGIGLIKRLTSYKLNDSTLYLGSVTTLIDYDVE